MDSIMNVAEVQLSYKSNVKSSTIRGAILAN
mgnify:CR=1 FL=1